MISMSKESPLTEADPRSLDDLYAADPLGLTNDDVDKIVSDLRQKRALWENEDKEAQAQGRARRPKTYKEPPPKGQLSLDSLGIPEQKK